MARIKPSSFRNVLVVVAIVVIGFMMFFGEEEPPPQPPPPAPAKTAAKPPTRSVPQATAGKFDAGQIRAALETGIWPPATDGASRMLDDLLVDNYLIVLDKSGSMEKSECSGDADKFTVARRAVQSFVDGLPGEVNVGLILFSSEVRVAVPLGGGSRDAFHAAIRRAHTGGKTALKASLISGWKALTRQAQGQNGYGTYHMVVITDGESSDGDPGPIARSIVTASAISLSVIGFCIGKGHSLDVAGYTSYTTASNPDELAQSLKGVRAEVSAFDAATFDSRGN